MIGPTALPALAAYLADLWHTDSSRISAIASIEKMGKQWPDAKGDALAILEERLEWFEENESDVNAFLVEALVELGAKEAAPLIERAFAEGHVDPMVMGDWEDVQVKLGLKSAEKVAQKRGSGARDCGRLVLLRGHSRRSPLRWLTRRRCARRKPRARWQSCCTRKIGSGKRSKLQWLMEASEGRQARKLETASRG